MISSCSISTPNLRNNNILQFRPNLNYNNKTSIHHRTSTLKCVAAAASTGSSTHMTMMDENKRGSSSSSGGAAAPPVVVDVDLGDRSYPIYIGSSFLNQPHLHLNQHRTSTLKCEAAACGSTHVTMMDQNKRSSSSVEEGGGGAAAAAAPPVFVDVDLGDRSYPIYIGPPLLNQPHLLQRHVHGKRVLVVTNKTVAPLYLDDDNISPPIMMNGKLIRNIGLPSAGDLDFTSLQVIKNGDLEELKELGSGTFGTVYHGKWRGTDVAIKRIKNSCFTGPSSAQATFWGEADIISKLHHPNVVAFYGVVQDGPGGTLATVVEFMVDGSLKHVLLRKDRYLDHHKRLLIAMDAAFGMEYLHSKNIIHFDLKCDNLLVNLKDPLRPICKVGDFGLSKIRKNTLVSGGARGTLPWMAPELFNSNSNKVSEKVDVFSYGITLWEILTGEVPYANMPYAAVLGGIANNTLRPVIPSYCDDDWRNLMEQCWAPIPAARPSFSQIATRLRTMSARIPT